MPDAPTLPCGWDALAGMLDAEWRGMDREAHPYHKGMMEAYSMIADEMRDTPADQREAALYRFLTRVFIRTGQEDVDE